jgi:hypothetical protein
MSYSVSQPLDFSFNYVKREKAMPLQNSSGFAKSRLHLFDYQGNKGKDRYAIAAKRISTPLDQLPIPINGHFLLKHCDHAGVASWYAINRSSFKKRFRVSSKELKGALDEQDVAKIDQLKALIQASLAKPPSSCWQRIATCYRKTVQGWIASLKKRKCYITAMVIGTLLLEPGRAIKAMCMGLVNGKRPFNYFRLNPKTLSKIQKEKIPILLIHGNYHNQTAWLSLAKKLRSSLLGPVYTLNLPSGPVTERDFALVEKKIKAIKAQYKKDIKIHLIGHSRGGFVAFRMAWTKAQENKRLWIRSKDIGKVIRIGSVSDKKELHAIEEIDPDYRKRLYEITGGADAIATASSLLPAERNKTFGTGHLGLLYSSKIHRQIIRWLQE